MVDYLNAVEELREIERKYDVMDIKYQGVSVWPVLRVYIVNKLFKDKKPQTVSTNYRLVLKTLFSYNPLKSFKRHDLWMVCGTGTRKKIGDHYVQQICGSLTELGYNMLMIEKADRVVGHYKKSEILEKDVLSLSWFYLLSFAIERLMRYKNLKLENEEVLRNILSDYGITFDYKFYVRLLIAQRKVTNAALSIFPRPKVLVIQAPYVYMGIVWAFHQKKIPVVELQHGVLNDHHYAYNPTYRNDLLMPDKICVFGDREYDLFMSDSSHFCKNVTKTGSFILEKSDEFFSKDIFADYRRKYKKIIVSAGEEGREQEMLSFIDTIAGANPEALFVHIPRIKTTELSKRNDNVEIVRGVNIYEYLKWCDIQMTISSTTCLEAHYFKKPNIFYDYEKLGSTYYGSLLNEQNGAFYITKPDEFNVVLDRIDNEEFKYKEIYAHHSKEKMKNVIDEYLK